MTHIVHAPVEVKHLPAKNAREIKNFTLRIRLFIFFLSLALIVVSYLSLSAALDTSALLVESAVIALGSHRAASDWKIVKHGRKTAVSSSYAHTCQEFFNAHGNGRSLTPGLIVDMQAIMWASSVHSDHEELAVALTAVDEGSPKEDAPFIVVFWGASFGDGPLARIPADANPTDPAFIWTNLPKSLLDRPPHAFNSPEVDPEVTIGSQLSVYWVETGVDFDSPLYMPPETFGRDPVWSFPSYGTTWEGAEGEGRTKIERSYFLEHDWVETPSFTLLHYISSPAATYAYAFTYHPIFNYDGDLVGLHSTSDLLSSWLSGVDQEIDHSGIIMGKDSVVISTYPERIQRFDSGFLLRRRMEGSDLQGCDSNIAAADQVLSNLFGEGWINIFLVDWEPYFINKTDTQHSRAGSSSVINSWSEEGQKRVLEAAGLSYIPGVIVKFFDSKSLLVSTSNLVVVIETLTINGEYGFESEGRYVSFNSDTASFIRMFVVPEEEVFKGLSATNKKMAIYAALVLACTLVVLPFSTTWLLSPMHTLAHEALSSAQEKSGLLNRANAALCHLLPELTTAVTEIRGLGSPPTEEEELQDPASTGAWEMSLQKAVDGHGALLIRLIAAIDFALGISDNSSWSPGPSVTSSPLLGPIPPPVPSPRLGSAVASGLNTPKHFTPKRQPIATPPRPQIPREYSPHLAETPPLLPGGSGGVPLRRSSLNSSFHPGGFSLGLAAVASPGPYARRRRQRSQAPWNRCTVEALGVACTPPGARPPPDGSISGSQDGSLSRQSSLLLYGAPMETSGSSFMLSVGSGSRSRPPPLLRGASDPDNMRLSLPRMSSSQELQIAQAAIRTAQRRTSTASTMEERARRRTSSILSSIGSPTGTVCGFGSGVGDPGVGPIMNKRRKASFIQPYGQQGFMGFDGTPSIFGDLRGSIYGLGGARDHIGSGVGSGLRRISSQSSGCGMYRSASRVLNPGRHLSPSSVFGGTGFPVHGPVCPMRDGGREQGVSPLLYGMPGPKMARDLSGRVHRNSTAEIPVLPLTEAPCKGVYQVNSRLQSKVLRPSKSTPQLGVSCSARRTLNELPPSPPLFPRDTPPPPVEAAGSADTPMYPHHLPVNVTSISCSVPPPPLPLSPVHPRKAMSLELSHSPPPF